MDLNVYLSGEIHTDWRSEIIGGCRELGLPIRFFSAVTDHQASDDVGDAILGAEADAYWKDHKSAKINAIRINSGIDRADVVVVKFGDRYKQWNAAFDAGYAHARGKSLIVLHQEDLTHALKEVDAAALAVAASSEQVVQILRYVLRDQETAP